MRLGGEVLSPLENWRIALSREEREEKEYPTSQMMLLFMLGVEIYTHCSSVYVRAPLHPPLCV